jgi:hypothetical protein
LFLLQHSAPRQVNGTVAGADADAAAAAKAGETGGSAAFRVARGARVAVVSLEGGGASLLTFLLGQVGL